MANTTDPAAPDKPEPHAALGERLRRERVERGLSLRELARRLDVSPSLVSQIENGKVQPSVRTLYAMVGELGISPDELFPSGAQPSRGDATARLQSPRPIVDEPSSPGIVQRAGSRRVIELDTGVRWERLTTANDREVEFLQTVYPPGSESSPADALMRHNGREFGLILSGTLNVTVGFEEYVLGPGDSIFFESTIPHRLYNLGADPVHAVWVVLGRHAN